MAVIQRFDKKSIGGTQTTPRWDLLRSGETLALDIEFQTWLPEGQTTWIQRIGRIAIVDTRYNVILDVFAYYPNEPGALKRVPPKRFGVSYKQLKSINGAQPAQRVEAWVKRILQGRTIILHDPRGDMRAFQHVDAFAGCAIVDTQVLYSRYQKNRRPGLATCYEEVFDESIQIMVHSPVEDACAVVRLYLAHLTTESSRNALRPTATAQDRGGYQEVIQSNRRIVQSEGDNALETPSNDGVCEW